VVSHGQGALVDAFLGDLERVATVPLEVVVVVNLPEDDGYARRARRFPVRVLHSPVARGFGANHNAALAGATTPVVVVANPDIRLTHDPLPALLRALESPRVGVCGPKVLSPRGTVEDSARRFPTVGRLLRRKLPPPPAPDYRVEGEPVPVDWVAGMFLAARRDVFAALGGFDERYFLYFEDVDLCRRARARGLEVVVEPRAEVIHDARRESRRRLRHFVWHATSATRYFWEWRGRDAAVELERGGRAGHV
jgi:hypothetical protein